MGYGKKEFGGVVFFQSNYMILKRLSVGIYAFQKLYPKEVVILTPFVSHETPNALSYGLSAGFHF